MRIKRILLVGQPHSGKSTLFQVLSDIKGSPGATSHTQSSEINIAGEHYELLDLPGVYSLNPVEPVEQITLDELTKNDIDLVINVINANSITRGLELTYELMELGHKVVVALNMLDVAEKNGIIIAIDELEQKLGIPVVPTVSLYGKGVKELTDIVHNTLNSEIKYQAAKFTHHLELNINEIEKQINPKDYNLYGNSRFYAIKLLENPQLLPKKLVNELSSITKRIESEIVRNHQKDVFETISYERHHLAMKLSEEVSTFQSRHLITLGEKLDTFLLHPFFGDAFLLGFFLLYFFLIFVVGTAIADLVEEQLDNLAYFLDPVQGYSTFLWYSLRGAYLGFSGVFGIVLPYFLPLIILTALFEESGYLSRVAFLLDGLFHKIGLHGKSVVPFVMGFGCSVPAIYATRFIENKRDRQITGILIPFIPCSARIAVIFALTAAFAGVLSAAIVFIWVMIIIAIFGKLLSKYFKKPMGLILEIPELKMPSVKISFWNASHKIKDFLRDALLFLVTGSVLLGWLEYFKLDVYVNMIFAPIVDKVLDLPTELGSTLIFGFFRKELIIVMMNQSLGVTSLSQLPLDYTQIMVFIIFVTLYFPCFTTFIVIMKEFGIKVVTASAVLSVMVALISAYLFKIVLNAIV